MIIDILRRAKGKVVVASVEDKLEILASRKVKLEADLLLDEAAAESYDLIVLPVSLNFWIVCINDCFELNLTCMLVGRAWWCRSICKI